MDYILLSKILSIAGIFLGIYLVYLCYQIYVENKLSMGWLAMCLGFLLMVLRRVLSFIYFFNPIEGMEQVILSVEEIIIILISIFFIVALVTLKNDLENLGILDTSKKKKKRV